MLTLVVDNKKMQIQIRNCKTDCQLFDEITNTCSINQAADTDSSVTLNKCQHTLLKTEIMEELGYKPSLDIEICAGDEFHEFLGVRFNKEQSNYPFLPDEAAKMKESVWYVSPCETYGCWIINKAAKKFLSVPKEGFAERGWSAKVYKSPYPLHDHEASDSLCSKMAWYIDEQGFGQYALLIDGKISWISSPRPSNWKET